MPKQKIPDAVKRFIEAGDDACLYSCSFTADGTKAVLLISLAYETFDLYIYESADQSLTNICGGPMGLQDIPATKAFWAEDHKLIMIANDGHPEQYYFPFEVINGGVRSGDTLDETPELRKLSKSVKALVTG